MRCVAIGACLAASGVSAVAQDGAKQPAGSAVVAPASTQAPLPAAKSAAKGALATVTFVDGRVVTAVILKETAETLWLDLGFDVLRAPRTSVETIDRGREETSAEDAPAASLYRAGSGLVERTPREVSEKYGEAVILISTPSGLGSGFIIHPDGYAVTNAHVIQKETKIKATVFQKGGSDFRRLVMDDCRIIAVNNHVDLALIRLNHPDRQAFPTVMVNTDDDLAAGQSVFAIGAPLGLERTLSAGVVATR